MEEPHDFRELDAKNWEENRTVWAVAGALLVATILAASVIAYRDTDKPQIAAKPQVPAIETTGSGLLPVPTNSIR